MFWCHVTNWAWHQSMLWFAEVKLMDPVIPLFVHQSLSGLFKPIELLHPCPPTAHGETKLSSARQLLDVLNQSSSHAFSESSSSIVKESFWQKGCGEVGIKLGSGSTVGQSSVLSGLSVSLCQSPPPKRICFLLLCVVLGALFIWGGSRYWQHYLLLLSVTVPQQDKKVSCSLVVTNFFLHVEKIWLSEV